MIKNLNTSMKFPVGDDEYEICLCDEHADDTTPKAAREALETKVNALEEYKKKMADMGFDLKEADSGLVLPVPAETAPVAAPAPVVKSKFVCTCGKSIKSKSGLKMHQNGCKVYAEKKAEDPEGDHFEIVTPPAPAPEPTVTPVEAEIIEYPPVPANIDVEAKPQSQPKILKKGGMSVNQNRAKTVGRVKGVSGHAEGQGRGAQVESHDSYDISEMIKETISELGDEDASPNRIAPNQEITEMQEVSDSRSGAVMAVPKKIESEMGTTLIQIVDSGGDKAIQERAKDMAHKSKSMTNEQWHAQNEYDSTRTVKCPLCRGTGITRIGNRTCPRCMGGGIMQ
jgi:hypothetical protein